MGYYVSPDSTSVTGASASTSSNMMDLTGRYVTTVSSVSNVRNNVTSEVLDLSTSTPANSTNISSASANISSSYYDTTGATVVSEVESSAAEVDSNLKENLRLFRGEVTGAEKALAYVCTIGLGILDIFEAGADGFAFFVGILGGCDLAEVTGALRDIDVKNAVVNKTGINTDGAFMVGQTIGRILICVGILAAMGALAAFSLPAAGVCAAVGALVGIGLAIDAGATTLFPIMLNSLKEACNFFLIATGIQKTIVSIKDFVAAGADPGLLFEALKKKLNLRDVFAAQKEKFLEGKLDFILKKAFKVDKATWFGEGVSWYSRVDSIVAFLSKTVLKIVDIVVATMSGWMSGGKSLYGYLVKCAYNFASPFISDIGDVFAFITDPVIDLISLKGISWSAVINALFSNGFKMVGWFFKDVVPAVE